MGDAPLGVDHRAHYSAAADAPGRTRPSSPPGRRSTATRRSPTSSSVGGWDGMAAIFDVIKADRRASSTGDKTMEFFKHWKNPDSPRGPISIDPETRDIVQNIYIRAVEEGRRQARQCRVRDDPEVKDPWKELNPPK